MKIGNSFAFQIENSIWLMLNYLAGHSSGKIKSLFNSPPPLSQVSKCLERAIGGWRMFLKPLILSSKLFLRKNTSLLPQKSCFDTSLLEDFDTKFHKNQRRFAITCVRPHNIKGNRWAVLWMNRLCGFEIATFYDKIRSFYFWIPAQSKMESHSSEKPRDIWR